jgi:cell division septal protein FtsQ
MGQHQNKNNLRHHRKKQAWPMLLLLGGGLLLVIGVAYAYFKPSTPKANAEVKGASSLKVDKEIIDMGDVKLGRTVEASFQLTNVGDQTLRFTKTPYIEVVEGC